MAVRNRLVQNSAKSQIDQTLRLGVVVQGPLLSTGRTLRDVRKREFVCAPEIERTYEMATELDAEFILITWADQQKAFSPNIPTNLIRQIDFPNKHFPLSFLNNWNNNNKYKQYYSTLMGVLELKKLGVTHVVKVRTDSFLDLRSVLDFFIHNSRLIPNAITAPALNVEKPDLFIDYYFGGAIENVENS